MASVTFLIGQFKEGHSSVFGNLHQRFFPNLVKIARRGLARGSPIPLDGEDIAQRVFLELYRTVRQRRRMGECLCDTASLRTTLATLTHQQVRRQQRDHTRQCRDVRKTRLATDLSGREDTDPLNRVFDRATLRWLRDMESQETLEQLLAPLPSAKHRTVVQLLAQEYSVTEIARELDCSVRTVQRYLVEIRSIWQSHPAVQATLGGRIPPPSVRESAPADR
jgi:RNA polymerase sigma factor (sigma-70 family)